MHLTLLIVMSLPASSKKQIPGTEETDDIMASLRASDFMAEK